MSPRNHASDNPNAATKTTLMPAAKRCEQPQKRHPRRRSRDTGLPPIRKRISQRLRSNSHADTKASTMVDVLTRYAPNNQIQPDQSKLHQPIPQRDRRQGSWAGNAQKRTHISALGWRCVRIFVSNAPQIQKETKALFPQLRTPPLCSTAEK